MRKTHIKIKRENAERERFPKSRTHTIYKEDNYLEKKLCAQQHCMFSYSYVWALINVLVPIMSKQ